jgi:hypothetical protein
LQRSPCVKRDVKHTVGVAPAPAAEPGQPLSLRAGDVSIVQTPFAPASSCHAR